MMTNSNCDDEVSAFESIMMYAVCRIINKVVISTSRRCSLMYRLLMRIAALLPNSSSLSYNLCDVIGCLSYAVSVILLPK